ncbi:hypothetical protein JRQ81_002590 [Phrynocephalus forsythii]|uniref:Uncharacterized protein n=1 Tax=Phrynocephalus forsythii TaxID=171643 RepID=A0A9Q0XI85_9SAUR|nr:hypothetical protein JRQ81_002590 [Phrynocephalus forsythii]
MSTTAVKKRKKKQSSDSQKRAKPRPNTPSLAHSVSTVASMPQEHLEDYQIPSRQPSTLSPTSVRSLTWGEDSHDLSTVVEVPLSPSNIQDLTSDLPTLMPQDTQAHRPSMSASLPHADAAPASNAVLEPPCTKAQAKRVRLPADTRHSRTLERRSRPRDRDEHSRHSCCSSPSTSPPRRQKHRRYRDSDSDSSSSYRCSRRRHRRRHRSLAHRCCRHSTSDSGHSADMSPRQRRATSVDAIAKSTDVERPAAVERPTDVNRPTVDRPTDVERPPRRELVGVEAPQKGARSTAATSRR